VVTCDILSALKKGGGGLCRKVILLRPRSGLNESSPALQRWVAPEGNRQVRETDG